MERKDFLRKGLAGAAAVFVTSQVAIAQDKSNWVFEKEPLTEENLNRFFNNMDPSKNRIMLDQTMADIKIAMEKHFAIEPALQRTIDNRTQADWKVIKGLLNDFRNKKGKLRFKFLMERGACKTRIDLVKTNTLPGGKINEIIVKTSIIS